MTLRPYYLTPEEVLVIEHAVRRAQAREMWRLAHVAARKVKALARSGARALSQSMGQAPAHGGDRARSPRATDIEAFAASLPAEIRARYASQLAAAARVEPLIDLGIAAWTAVVRALAQGFHGVARGLHAAARSLEVAARHLTPTH